MEQRRQLSNCKMIKMGRHLPPQMTISLKGDLENWWVRVAEEMKVAFASSNSHTLLGYYVTTVGFEFRLVKGIQYESKNHFQ